ncbi:methylcrotonoyl-CoA carboxylase [Sphingomonas sp. Leaf17]|uniref:acetyl/propionyl/methylcrotonyl-CoA carboxylase subunit alpha n=1 Tax=Sphingomonas sp. Leaf17 TaxID=1735683 RepID=UPI0007005FCC|nr:biotin carboxylase N-terminal domain-containing protein [Sphingomonas sp. Leaf17]KQM64376.1 methylcrotonoyl-CoA carboxylase [Sphingomonas sp. Leaf17]
MIQSLLIANRGEIACRIIRTAKAMGIRTIAVYSDADADALHVRAADAAVHIGPAPVRESYLLGDRIIAAAREAGAEAIHPGYGFLSENAAFAQSVIDARLVWVGAPPASITAMGLKDAAKARMIAAGVPVTPGYQGADQSPERLADEASAIGYPVLIKAVAGGGGKGMRKVDAPADFAEALASCRREAAASFGNDHVLLEKWITNPRHIEVQVFGDTHGQVVHLFERDCSLQRRHQKVIEEAPAPGMDPATRDAICAAAVRAAKAVDYVGAGTIEFIADAGLENGDGLRADRIWFMEMNTRLQVEHPVTEAITGVDLVEWQLRVASGEPLPMTQGDLSITGWAMEARLYAEDPAKGFLPSIGRLDRFALDGRVRVDTGVDEGGEISPWYDPMIAKLIAHGPTRDAARTALSDAVAGSVIWPLRTNAGFLVKALAHPDFVAGTMDTGLIARAGGAMMPADAPPAPVLAQATGRLLGATALPGFRLNAAPVERAMVLVDGTPVETAIGPRVGSGMESVLLTDAGQSWPVTRWRVDLAGGAAAGDGSILSPMPGRIIAVAVAQGDRVCKGQPLLTLEAMKMEHALVAPFDGVVAELAAVTGAQVNDGLLLARIAKDEG